MLLIQQYNIMKAIDIKGNIKTYTKLPTSWGNIIAGFNLLPDNELQEFGFYDLVIPDFNIKTQELSNLVFDNDFNAFTYVINNKTWAETLEELKEQAIKDLSTHTKIKLSETDWYVTRKVERNIDIPQDIQDTRENIFNSHNQQEEEINNLTKKSDVIAYEFR